MEVMMQGHDNLVSTLRFRSKMLENIHGQSGSGNFQVMRRKDFLAYTTNRVSCRPWSSDVAAIYGQQE